MTNFIWVLSIVLLAALSCPAAEAAIQVKNSPQALTIITRNLQLACNLTTGRWGAQWIGGKADRPIMRGVTCAAKLGDGTELDAQNCSEHRCKPSDVTPIRDNFGPGTQIVIHHRKPGLPELRQIFRVYPALSYFFVRLEIISPHSIASNNISPLVFNNAKTLGAGMFLNTGEKLHTLSVPYDNDAWVRYNSDMTTDSHEVTAVYDNSSRHGFVLGSVTHDLWKTGITAGNLAKRTVGSLRIYGGAADKETRDTQPHGLVSGTRLVSPLIFVGYATDWRTEMETFARANTRFQPPLTWNAGVPFGWNSWSAYQTKINHERYLAASDFLNTSLQNHGFVNNATVYVNFDSYWDNLSEPQIEAAVRHVHAQGQKAGIYWSPFVCWGGDLKRPVEGTDGRYTYQEILLKDASGKPLPTLDGGMALDPTHPGTLARIDWQFAKFVRQGFDFVKIDFLTHGALEGAHFDPRITTGTAAYNRGMARICTDLAPGKIGRPFFISLSIAPLFPSGYGHSRRISCDISGGIGPTEYLLNSLTYGWWAGGILYPFNDPDSSVLYQETGESIVNEAEARSRLTASVITGAPMLDGDDLTNPAAQARAVLLLSHPRINALARTAHSFRPSEGNTGTKACDVFVRTDPASKQCYVAIFNYSKTDPQTKSLDLARLGLSMTASYRAVDLWNSTISQIQGKISLLLAPADCRLLCLTKNGK